MNKSVLFITLPLMGVAKAADNGKPNVIFIYADDLGKGMLSEYGQQFVQTPNLDKLLRQGVRFENSYGCMLSAPARASLLTGYHDCNRDKWSISNGGLFVTTDTATIAGREVSINSRDVVLPDGDLYIAQVFQKAGYVTSQIGKLEWGFTATRSQMRRHGWDYYYGYLDHVRCHGFYPPFLFNNGEIDIIEGNLRTDCGKTIEPESEKAYADRWNMEGKKQYSQDIFLDKILNFIDDNKDRPFFLFHPTQLPHGPVQVKAIDPQFAVNERLTPIEKEYATMVKMLDDQVGIIIKRLEELKLMENTIIVFAADNGHEIYYSTKGRTEKPYRNMKSGELFDDYRNKYYSSFSGDVFNGNAGMAGLKRSNLDGGVRVPLMMYWKGRWDRGDSCQELVAMYDLLPTFADLLCVEAGKGKNGVSLLPMIRGEKLPQDRFVVYSSMLGPAIVTNDGWKLRYYRSKGIYELYNLRTDPKETTDLAAENVKLVEALRAQLLAECKGDVENGYN